MMLGFVTLGRPVGEGGGRGGGMTALRINYNEIMMPQNSLTTGFVIVVLKTLTCYKSTTKHHHTAVYKQVRCNTQSIKCMGVCEVPKHICEYALG